MEELAGTSTGQQETEAAEQEKVNGKPREDEPVDKATAAKKKFRYQISILTSPEIDGTLSKLLGTMVSVSFQTMLQASRRLLKGLRQLLTRKRVEVEEAPELQEQDTEEAEAPQGVSNLQSIPGGLGELEKAFADIRLSLPDREGGEVMRAPLGTKLSFHALPLGKLKIQIGTHHTDALVDGRAEITLIRRDLATVTGCTVNKEVGGSIRGAGGEIPFTGYVTKCAVRVGIRESIWSFQQMTVIKEMDHDVILERPWCANVEMIGMHLHDGTYMVDIEDPVTDRGELLRLLGTGGDPPKGKLATWSPTFEESARKGAFPRMEGMRERVEIMIEEAFSKKEWIKMGLPVKKRRPEDESLKVMVAEKGSEVELGANLPKPKEARNETSEVVLEIPDLLQLVKTIRYHKVRVDFAALARFEDGVRKGYCFAKIAEPIRVMIRKGSTMDWTEDREEAAQTLKDILSSDHVTLAAPCFNDEVKRPFILETDGGPLAVGGVLIQRSEEGKERPIRFESRTMNSAERRYSQFKKEVLAILHCLKTFKAYLFGRRFILRIDPTNVVGALKNYKPIDPTVGRWIGFIWQFDYKVERIAGLRNRADGLSRVCITPEGVEDAEPIDAFLEYEGGTLVMDNEMANPTITTGQLLIQTLEKGAPAVVAELRERPVTTVRRKEEKDSWGAEVGAREELMAMTVEGGRDAVMTLAEAWAQKEYQYLVNLTREEQGTNYKEQEFFLIQMYESVFKKIGLLLVGNKQPTEVSPKAREEVEKYVLRNDHLFKKEEGMIPRRVVCGRSRQLDVIQAMHDGLAEGHRSSKGTLAKIVPLYFWPGMAGMVATYYQTCLICQERSVVRVYEPLRPTWVLGPGHLVYLDLAVMPVSTDGFRYILDARDNLSGYVEAIALKKKTGKAVADWVEDFYLRHPFVRRFIADNGTKFVNQKVLNRLKTLCVPIKITELYHPEANAPVERGHRTLKNTIAKLAANNLGSWSRFLKQAVFAENMTPKRTTGCIPAELWYGREIDFPIEALVPTWNRLDNDPHLSTEELITARCQQVARNEEALEEVANRMTDNRMRDKARWDQVKNIRKEPLQGQTRRKQQENSKMEYRNENDSNAINRPEEGQSSRQAGESSSRKRKLYVGFDHNLVVNRGGKKQGTKGPSPLKEGEPIELPSDSDPSSKEEGNPEEGQWPGENEPVEFIDLTRDEEENEVTTLTREDRGREEDLGEEKDPWKREFGPTFSDWFDQWASILRCQWAMKGQEKLSRGEDISPTTFFSEETLRHLKTIKRLMEQEMEVCAKSEARCRAPGQ
ncbi:hypothetical protein CBR_g8233 [Chara braunii]|uniref:Integrase catalytic domain-containing protein n=1 Tax=Chara braunii TaxID=69332 RepID=A0A388KLL3_CHABU|nr:hypothetical protein CBR_g8233 [Chara braunii]|eukprot:GBG70932.1 hypothetical protein CBR_g8233 [Chara braunii]